MWDLCWREWHWDRISASVRCSSASMVTSIIYTDFFIYQWRCAQEFAVSWNNSLKNKYLKFITKDWTNISDQGIIYKGELMKEYFSVHDDSVEIHYSSPISVTICMLCVGWSNIAVAATRYGLNDPGIESRCGLLFPHPFRLSLGPPCLLAMGSGSLSQG